MRLGDFLGSGIFLSDGDAWRRHRKIASSEFSTRKLREHSNTVFREDAVRLANVLNSAMAANEPVEFQVLLIDVASMVNINVLQVLDVQLVLDAGFGSCVIGTVYVLSVGKSGMVLFLWVGGRRTWSCA